MKGTARKLLSNSLSSLLSKPFSPSSSIVHHHHAAKSPLSSISRVFHKPFSTTTNNSTTDFGKDTKAETLKKFWDTDFQKLTHSESWNKFGDTKENGKVGFGDLGLSDELLVAVKKMNLEGPNRNQRGAIPTMLEGCSVILGSNGDFPATTFAYLLPIIQLLRRDEALLGIAKHRHPRAVILCPSMELSDMILRFTKLIMHYARGGDGSYLQDVSFDIPIGFAIGTPSILLHKVEKGEIVYDDIKYLVLEDADVMFDNGFGSDMCKFYGRLKDLSTKSDGRVLQRVLVISSISKVMTEKELDQSFQRKKIEQYMRDKLPGYM